MVASVEWMDLSIDARPNIRLPFIGCFREQIETCGIEFGCIFIQRGRWSGYGSLDASCVRCDVDDIFRHQMESVIFYQLHRGCIGPELALFKGLELCYKLSLRYLYNPQRRGGANARWTDTVQVVLAVAKKKCITNGQSYSTYELISCTIQTIQPSVSGYFCLFIVEELNFPTMNKQKQSDTMG